ATPGAAAPSTASDSAVGDAAASDAPTHGAAPSGSVVPSGSAAPKEPETQPNATGAPSAAKPPPPQALMSSWQAACPAEMTTVTRIKATYCIDRFEGSLERVTKAGRSPWPHNESIDGRERELVAVSVKGRRPQGYISGDQAAKVCGAAGKRLCANDEWVTACRGPAASKYPYGNQRTANTCNDRFKVLDN